MLVVCQGSLAIRGEDMVKFTIPMALAIVVPIVLTFFFRQAGIFNKNDLVGAGDAAASDPPF